LQKPFGNIIDDIYNKYHNLSHDELLEYRKQFYDKLSVKYRNKKKRINFDMFDIFIVIPKKVNISTFDEKCVATLVPDDFQKIDDFIKLTDWADAFNSNKWKGYVFVHSKIDVDLAFKTAEEMLLGGRGVIISPASSIKKLSYAK